MEHTSAEEKPTRLEIAIHVMASSLSPLIRAGIRPWVCLIAVLALGFATFISAQAKERSLTSVDETIAKSLAHIIVHEGKNTFSGTGFCIGSHDSTAYILTNKHVVGSDPKPRVVLLSDPDSELYGRIERLSTLDAAVIAVDNATCPPLKLSSFTPVIGTEIGIAGFPMFQIVIADNALKAEPSFHAGSVNALPENGGYIEYDAQTDHGNSGSPLFDARTGVVVGMVTLVNTGKTGALQNNLSISMKALASFLANSKADVALSATSESQIGTPAALQSTETAAASNAIDAKCGVGVSAGIYKSLSRASSETNANDYVAASNDDRMAIESSNECAIKFACPGDSCNESQYTLLTATTLLAQQNLRLAAARTGGDAVNAVRNELDTAVNLCSVQNIMSDAKPFSIARDAMKVSLKLSRVIRAEGPYRGIVDAQPVRDCATRLGI